jgi:hypothetical protein
VLQDNLNTAIVAARRSAHTGLAGATQSIASGQAKNARTALEGSFEPDAT